MFTTRPELTGTHGMIASTHWLASASGMAVLEDGGNAFDAATAAGFVLQVVEPHLNGPGGEVPVLFATANDPRPRALCGQGPAPRAATIARYREELGLELIPGTGLLAATVPGAWDGWLTLLRDHGTKPLREVLHYGLGYARGGFPVVPRLSGAITALAELMRTSWPSSARQWLTGGKPPKSGSLITNPRLADTWERLLVEAESAGADRETQIEAARRAWSEGFIAERIDEFCRTPVPDAAGAVNAGLLTAQDMADYAAHYEQPCTVDIDGWALSKFGVWTQGPVLAQQLRLLQELTENVSYVGGVPSEETVHLAAECAKLAFADREAFYGDSADDQLLDDLLAPSYAVERSALISERANNELRPGAPGGRVPALPGYVHRRTDATGSGLAFGEPTTQGPADGDTVHIDVVDRWGNLVSATPSGGWLQSSPMIDSLGFCLGTRAQMFNLDEAHPNALAPGKRPRITLSPSLVSRGGEPVLAFGTPGGDQQDQWQLCFWLAHIGSGLNLQEAIDAPAWNSGAFPASFYPRSWQPGRLVVESRLGESTIARLRRRGHDVVDAGPWALGRLSAVCRDPNTGVLRAAANPRGAQGYAVGR